MPNNRKRAAGPAGKAIAKPQAKHQVKTRPEDLLRVAQAKLMSMQMERDFWVEQARSLQNHLATVMRGQSQMLEQMARSSMTSDDVRGCCERIAQELRQPLTTVEATMALAAVVREGSQGRYTPVNGGAFEALVQRASQPVEALAMEESGNGSLS
ncbi:hypothetical protein EII18_08360 [Comamonadaceae bacterium OH3737_COT-264]|nr:hypothetical protein EII18_08360 [Comamonadaceae bacterium OH3737_COT-264]